MKTEKSCGAIVFTKDNGKTEYVIVRSNEDYYGFPKGHMEHGETEKETALREVLEETGLRVNILDGFRTEDAYRFCYKGEYRFKEVVYFLAEYSGQIPVAQESELRSIHLLSFADAIDVFQFENLKHILTQAQTYLTGQEELFC